MKISIIIPTFNRCAFLGEALRSIQEQTYRDVEIVVVDDGSTDGTCDLVSEVKRECDASVWGGRILYIKQNNKGAPIARNTGVAHATGDCILFMDSDDLLTKTGLSAVMGTLENSDVDFVYCRVQEVDDLGRILPRNPIGRRFDDTGDGLMDYSWHTMGAVYRRNCVDRTGGWNTELSGSQDWEFQVRVKLLGVSGRFQEDTIGYWRQHEAGRVGANTFRPKYVQSVMKACALIAKNAQLAGRYDRVLRTRLTKRLLVHSVECGSAGYTKQKNECLRQAAGACPSDSALKFAIKALRWSPRPSDFMMNFALRRVQGRA